MVEESLLTSELEYTNEPYAIAKIAGIKLCESYNYQYGTNYKCLMPSNLFGPNDNYNSNNSHFFPAIIKKLYLVSYFLLGAGVQLLFVENRQGA